jgi:hypothetical protein
MRDMYTVELDDKAMRDLTALAQARNVEVSVIASEAVRAYIRAEAQRAMEKEVAAFHQLHPHLLETIPNEYAAIHGGKLVDHDPDLVTLYERISKQFDGLPVLLRQVRAEPEEVLVIRSPRIEYE